MTSAMEDVLSCDVAMDDVLRCDLVLYGMRIGMTDLLRSDFSKGILNYSSAIALLQNDGGDDVATVVFHFSRFWNATYSFQILMKTSSVIFSFQIETFV